MSAPKMYTIPEELSRHHTRSEFNMLVNAVKATGLANTLSTGKYTLFAPTNIALEAAKADSLDRDTLKAVLLYHVVKGEYFSSEFPEGDTEVTTVGGGTIVISKENGTVFVKGENGDRAIVIEADIYAENGTIHVIDRVLLPLARVPT